MRGVVEKSPNFSDFQYRVTLVVWHKLSIKGQINNHIGNEPQVSAKPPGSPCTQISDRGDQKIHKFVDVIYVSSLVVLLVVPLVEVASPLP